MATTNNLKLKYVMGVYDATTDGALGTNTLRITSSIPQGSIIRHVVLQTLQAFLPAGGAETIRFKINGGNISANLGQAALDPALTVPIQTGYVWWDNNFYLPIQVVCSNGAFSQGKVRVIVGYHEPAAN